MTATYIIEQNEGVGLGSDYTYLQWTAYPPTQVGWYWALNKEDVYMVSIEGNVSTGFVAVVGDYPDRLESFSHWIGPLPKPNKP
jgi:hypothetical protein